MVQLVGILADHGHLRPDLDVATAADVYYSLVNEAVFEMLSTDCGWSVERFQRWVTELMQAQLLDPSLSA